MFFVSLFSTCNHSYAGECTEYEFECPGNQCIPLARRCVTSTSTASMASKMSSTVALLRQQVNLDTLGKISKLKI